jgi:hypothetical protein
MAVPLYFFIHYTPYFHEDGQWVTVVIKTLFGERIMGLHLVTVTVQEWAEIQEQK